jgi:hypothetical protein
LISPKWDVFHESIINPVERYHKAEIAQDFPGPPPCFRIASGNWKRGLQVLPPSENCEFGDWVGEAWLASAFVDPSWLFARPLLSALHIVGLSVMFGTEEYHVLNVCFRLIPRLSGENDIRLVRRRGIFICYGA